MDEKRGIQVGRKTGRESGTETCMGRETGAKRDRQKEAGSETDR